MSGAWGDAYDRPHDPYGHFALAAIKCRDLDAHKPAGDTLLYREEEPIGGLSNLACRRVATLLEKIALAELSGRRPASRALALPNQPTG